MIVYANHESLAYIDVSKEIMPMKKKFFCAFGTCSMQFELITKQWKHWLAEIKNNKRLRKEGGLFRILSD